MPGAKDNRGRSIKWQKKTSLAATSENLENQWKNKVLGNKVQTRLHSKLAVAEKKQPRIGCKWSYRHNHLACYIGVPYIGSPYIGNPSGFLKGPLSKYVL